MLEVHTSELSLQADLEAVRGPAKKEPKESFSVLARHEAGVSSTLGQPLIERVVGTVEF